MLHCMILMVSMSMAVNSNHIITGCGSQDYFSGNREEGYFLGMGMGGVILTLNTNHSGSDLRDYISHLDGSQSHVETFVPTFGAGTLDGLLDAVGSEDPVDHRNTSLQAHTGNAF